MKTSNLHCLKSPSIFPLCTCSSYCPCPVVRRFYLSGRSFGILVRFSVLCVMGLFQTWLLFPFLGFVFHLFVRCIAVCDLLRGHSIDARWLWGADHCQDVTGGLKENVPVLIGVIWRRTKLYECLKMKFVEIFLFCHTTIF